MNAQISLKNQIDVPKELAGADDDIASLEFLDGTVFQKPLDGFQVHIFKQTDTLQIPFADAAGGQVDQRGQEDVVRVLLGQVQEVPPGLPRSLAASPPLW